MFEQSTLPEAPKGKQLFATIAGFTSQALLITGLILAPMIWPQVLPQALASIHLIAPTPPMPPGPTIIPKGAVSGASVPRLALNRRTYTEPRSMPKSAATIIDMPETSGVVGAVATSADSIGGTGGPGVFGAFGDPIRAAPPIQPPPAPVHAPTPAGPKIIDIRRGGDVKMARILHRVEPVYPPLARQARVSGSVELEGVIATDGHIRQLRIKSGHPLLVKAAYDAVAQWLYEATTLNGQPVEVLAPITVTFILN